MDLKAVDNHPAVVAAGNKLTEAIEARDKAAKRLARLQSKAPAVPLVERARNWLSGGSTAVAEPEIDEVELAEASDELAVMEQAVELQETVCANTRRDAIEAVLRAGANEHKQHLRRLCDALAATTAAVDDLREFWADCHRVAAGQKVPFPEYMIDHRLALQIKNAASQFPATIASYLRAQ